MNQFVEKSLSPPRGLDCCVSRMNPLAWNISIQFPFIAISMGTGVEFGSALVPELAWPMIACVNVFGCMDCIMSAIPCLPPFIPL